MDDAAEYAIAALTEMLEDKQHELKQNDGQVASLQEKSELIKGEVKALEKTIEMVRERFMNPELPNTSTNGKTNGKYTAMTLSKAVVDVVERFGESPGISASQILQYLEREGFKTEAKKPYYSVYGVARDLVERKQINEGERDGKKVFIKKQPF